MTAAFWLTHGPLVLYLLSAFGLGWGAREFLLWWHARRFSASVMKRIEEDEAAERARRVAVSLGMWHVDAESDAEAWTVFHRRTLLGVEGRP